MRTIVVLTTAFALATSAAAADKFTLMSSDVRPGAPASKVAQRSTKDRLRVLQTL